MMEASVLKVAARIERAIDGVDVERGLTALAVATGVALVRAAEKNNVSVEGGIDIALSAIVETVATFEITGHRTIGEVYQTVTKKPGIASVEHLLQMIDAVEEVDRVLEFYSLAEPDKYFIVGKVLGILAANHPKGMERGMDGAELTVTNSVKGANKFGIKSVSDYVAAVRRQHAKRGEATRSENLSEMLRQKSPDFAFEIFSGATITNLKDLLEEGGDGSECPIQSGDMAECIITDEQMERYKQLTGPSGLNVYMPKAGTRYSVRKAETVPLVYKWLHDQEGWSPFVIEIEADGHGFCFPADWFKKVDSAFGADTAENMRRVEAGE